MNLPVFESQNPKTKKFGLDNMARRASQLWENVSKEVRNLISLTAFKKSIKEIHSPSIHTHTHA